MRNSKLEGVLRNWFNMMVDRYKWLSIKFEYNEKRGIYLVSYSPVSKIGNSDDFIKDSMEFEDKINSLYGDASPLFCDEEKYFKLSSNAETIEHRDYEFFNISIANQEKDDVKWDIPEAFHEGESKYYTFTLAA